MNSDFIPTDFKDLFPIMEQALASGKKTQFTVTGNSMFPLFRDGRDTVVLARSSEYKKRDIIFYIRSNGDFVLHRVIKKKAYDPKFGNETVYYLCGDNQHVLEYPIYENQILAKAVAFIRKGKEFTTDNFKYRLYVRFWCAVRRFRPYIINPVMKIYKRIRRRKKN